MNIVVNQDIHFRIGKGFNFDRNERIDEFASLISQQCKWKVRFHFRNHILFQLLPPFASINVLQVSIMNSRRENLVVVDTSDDHTVLVIVAKVIKETF